MVGQPVRKLRDKYDEDEVEEEFEERDSTIPGAIRVPPGRVPQASECRLSRTW
jgi:hypothetical protein